MKSKDLMYGNVIRKANDSSVCSVVNIFGPSDLIDYSLNGITISGSECSILNFTPILLNRDVLVNALDCVEDVGQFHMTSYCYDDWLTLYLNDEGEFNLFTHTYGNITVTHLHELQNYYHLISGDNLIIDLTKL